MLAAAKSEIDARAKARFEAEQRKYAAKVIRREAQRQAGKRPRGKEPQPPEAGPRDQDQVNLTDAKSRIMPVAGGGFEQAYNLQAAVDATTMLVLATGVTQQPNDKRHVEPMLAALPEALGRVERAAMDNGYYSAANVKACLDRQIEPLIALGREAHHPTSRSGSASTRRNPSPTDPVVRMAWRLKTRAGRTLYAQRKATVEPVFGIIKQAMGFMQFSLRGLAAVAGEWALVTLAFNLKRMNVLRLA